MTTISKTDSAFSRVTLGELDARFSGKFVGLVFTQREKMQIWKNEKKSYFFRVQSPYTAGFDVL